MLPDLLATKLYIPPVRKNLVSRAHLIQALNLAWQHDKNMILVSAPAGYGKTTLVTEWLGGLQAKTCWLSLDETDNDPARFLAYLIAALRQVDVRIGQKTSAMLKSPPPLPPEIVLTSLVNEIAGVTTPFLLVLDDYHVIRAMQIHQQLGFLVDHQPPSLRLVMITREDPPLPLARLRVRGQMLEIRQKDLRFTKEECDVFLQRIMGLRLSQRDIEILERRTEGWIAGLQLAALSMQGRDDLSDFIKAFSGSSHFVLEYLIEEVFELLSAEEQEFLLKTSILDRLNGSLCDAMAGREGSNVILEHLEKINLFIIPLDQSHTWYRYHNLFAELLRQRLDASSQFSRSELHRLASRWFLANGFIPEAIQHALAAGDWENVAGLIQANSVELLRRGELMTLLGWCRSLPDDVIYTHPELCRDYGWALTLTGQFTQAEAYLHKAESAAQNNPDLLGTILVAWAYNLHVRGNNPGAIDYARRALSILPLTDALSRGLVALTLGLAYWTSGDFQAAEEAFGQVDQTAQQSGNHYARLTALTYLGMIQGVYGHLHQASELCQQVIQLGGQSPPVAPAQIELGALLYEWNKLEDAIDHLQTGIEQARRSGNPLIQSDGYRTLAIAKQAQGDSGGSLATLQQADQLVESRQVSALTAMRTAACHVQVALAQNNIASAQTWASQVNESTDTSPLFPCIGLTWVRLLLAQGDRTAAAQQLSGLYETASQKRCGAGLVEIRALQSMAADCHEDALIFLQDALQKGHFEGYVRTFVDKGEPMKTLLERLRSQGGEFRPYIVSLLAAFGEPTSAPASQPLLEPVSDREIEILVLVAEGLSNQQIANRLVIGIGTAKSHVHHILEKLGCSSRTQAVAKARELGLL